MFPAGKVKDSCSLEARFVRPGVRRILRDCKWEQFAGRRKRKGESLPRSLGFRREMKNPCSLEARFPVSQRCFPFRRCRLGSPLASEQKEKGRIPAVWRPDFACLQSWCFLGSPQENRGSVQFGGNIRRPARPRQGIIACSKHVIVWFLRKSWAGGLRRGGGTSSPPFAPSVIYRRCVGMLPPFSRIALIPLVFRRESEGFLQFGGPIPPARRS